MHHTIVFYFTRVAACLLFLSAAFKLVAGFGDSAYLTKLDPIVPIQTRYLLFLAGCVEILVAVLVCSLESPRYKLATICWIASNLASYRMAISLTGSSSLCFCWGGLGRLLDLSPYTLDRISYLVLAYLFVGGFYLFYKDLRHSQPEGLATRGS